MLIVWRHSFLFWKWTLTWQTFDCEKSKGWLSSSSSSSGSSGSYFGVCLFWVDLLAFIPHCKMNFSLILLELIPVVLVLNLFFFFCEMITAGFVMLWFFLCSVQPLISFTNCKLFEINQNKTKWFTRQRPVVITHFNCHLLWFVFQSNKLPNQNNWHQKIEKTKTKQKQKNKTQTEQGFIRANNLEREMCRIPNRIHTLVDDIRWKHSICFWFLVSVFAINCDKRITCSSLFCFGVSNLFALFSFSFFSFLWFGLLYLLLSRTLTWNKPSRLSTHNNSSLCRCISDSIWNTHPQKAHHYDKSK